MGRSSLTETKGCKRTRASQESETKQDGNQGVGGGLQCQSVQGHEEGDEDYDHQDLEGGARNTTVPPHSREAEGAGRCAEASKLQSSKSVLGRVQSDGNRRGAFMAGTT